MREVDFKDIKGVEDIAKNFYSEAAFIYDFLKSPKLISLRDAFPELTTGDLQKDGLKLIDQLTETADQMSFYKSLRIPKKNKKRKGEFRIVYKGDFAIKQLQKNIATAIENQATFPSCVQGFVKKRSTTTNATQHLGKQLILNADIKDFFDSINIQQVTEVFILLGCEQSVAAMLAKICTLNGVLAQGLHTSPILANIVAFPLDGDFIKLAQKHSCTYTRYGDDMTFSSNDQLPAKKEIEEVLATHGFALNESKFSITKRGQAQFVTGLSIFESDYPRIPKRFKRWLRLIAHYMNKHGVDNHLEHLEVWDHYTRDAYFRRIKGTLDYLNASEPGLAAKLSGSIPIEFKGL